jgi:ABC-type lipoprotein export system ATPase subunit/bifunctional DNA-binding transcriptional regulator/antitoxin component of YhaV-PrlF toxin-antitoxin module
MNGNPLIICDNLVRIYQVSDLEVVALQGLDLEVAAGEMLGIVGASGSGKSTLLNILGGLDRPSAGRVSVDEQDLLKLSDRALDRYRRSQVGFVWQQTARNLIPYLSARENVALPMTVAGVGLRKKRARSRELLEAVGLWEHRKHRLAQLSGGQQQRVAIAVALANEPKLLLADEPTGEVDSVTAQAILDLLRRFNETRNLTTIIVTHDQRIARQVDRVIAIRDGRTSSEVIRGDRSKEVDDKGDDVRSEDDLPLVEDVSLFSEHVVVDSAGRLQVPKDYLEQVGIGDRVTLDVTDGGIVIRPVAGRQRARASLVNGLDDEPPSSPERGMRGWWKRVRKRT